MKVSVFGAGAVGGFIAGMLAEAGHDISLVARGPHLEAVRHRGLTLETGGRRLVSRPHASDRPEDLGPQDVVIVSVKSPALAQVVPALGPLLGRDTVVVFAMNGIPWWFFHGLGGPFEGHHLRSVDPDGRLTASLDVRRVMGCVVHIGCLVPAPGVVRHASGNLFILGDPAGGESARCTALAQAFNAAGLKTEIARRIQQDIWMKFLGNMSMGPISVLTGSTLRGIAEDPGGSKVCIDMMTEAMAVGARFGLDPGMTAERRLALGAELGHFKTSMLQDFEKQRPMEIDTLVSVVIEMARLVGLPVPTIETVHALVVHKARLAGLYPGVALPGS
jgi:2-dehydropantoate 2-reductase